MLPYNTLPYTTMGSPTLPYIYPPQLYKSDTQAIFGIKYLYTWWFHIGYNGQHMAYKDITVDEHGDVYAEGERGVKYKLYSPSNAGMESVKAYKGKGVHGYGSPYASYGGLSEKEIEQAVAAFPAYAQIKERSFINPNNMISVREVTLDYSMCGFCKKDIFVRSSGIIDMYMYEFSQIDREGREFMKRNLHAHEYCMEPNVGNVHTQISEIGRPVSLCHMCHEDIVEKYKTKTTFSSGPSSWATATMTTTTVPLNPPPVYILAKGLIINRDQRRVKMVGHIDFCDNCWLDMAGENFFDR
jgi:hypothetical protein